MSILRRVLTQSAAPAAILEQAVSSESWSAQLDQLFAAHSDPDRAVRMSRYTRDQFHFHGLDAATRHRLLRQHQQSLGTCADPLRVASALWALPARECQLAGVDIVNHRASQLDPDQLAQAIVALVQKKSWWDTVDMLASNALGLAFKSTSTQGRYLVQFRQSPDFWMRRCALIFQLKYRDAADLDLLFAVIDENLGSREFFINKAIGWSLRQAARCDRARVENYVASRSLAPLSRREALR